MTFTSPRCAAIVTAALRGMEIFRSSDTGWSPAPRVFALIVTRFPFTLICGFVNSFHFSASSLASARIFLCAIISILSPFEMFTFTAPRSFTILTEAPAGAS